MDRRSFIAAAPTVVAFPFAAQASGSNLLSVWHRVIAQKEITDNGPDMDSPEYEVALARLNQLQDEIARAPAQSVQDMAIKILNADDYGVFESDSYHCLALVAEARALVAA